MKSPARLPCDLMLELDVLASCLARPDMVLTIGLSEDDFAHDGHRLVWRAMQDLLEIGESVDLVRIRSRLIDADSLKQVGGEEFLAKVRATPPAKSLPVERLRRMAKMRAMRAMAEAVANAAAGNDPDMASVALEGAQALSGEATRTKRPKTARELGQEWLESQDKDPNEGT